MEVFLFIAIGVGIGAVIAAYLCMWSIEKESDKEMDRKLQDMRIRILVQNTVWNETERLERGLTRYIDTKLAEMDKQEESREEDKHE